jgi:hypothetical protein
MLTPLDLNLATRPFRNNTLPWAAVLVGAIALVTLTWWNVSTYMDYGDRLDRLRDDLRNFDARMAALEQRDLRATRGINEHDLEFLTVQTVKANSVIELKAFSWTRLFNQLEEVLPYDVRMTSILPVFRIGQRPAATDEPDDDGVPVTVEGVAKTLNDFYDLQRNLLSDPRFDRVEPDRHLPGDTGDVVFKLRFRYYPDAPGEPAPEELAAGGEEDEGGDPVEPAPDAEPQAEPSDGTDESRAGAGAVSGSEGHS